MTQPKDTSELVARLRRWEGDGHPHGLLHRQAADELVNAYRIIGEMRERVERAYEEVCDSLNREHKDRTISYRELKAGVNNSAVIRDAALNPSREQS